MTPDDEIRHRFSAHRDSTSSIHTDAALSALEQSQSRRTNLRRGAGVGALMVVLFGVLFAAASLTSDEPTEIETAEDDTPTTTIDPPDKPTVTSEPITTTPTTATGDAATTAVVTVDLDGVIRINETIWEPNIDHIDPPVQVRAVAGASGLLLLETTGGIYAVSVDNPDARPMLWHKAHDARLLDVSEPMARNIVDWTIPDGNTPSGEVVRVDEFAPGGVRDRELFPMAPFGERVVGGSLGGPGNAHILFSIETDGGECVSRIVRDLDGSLATPENYYIPIDKTDCKTPRIAAWSEAGIIVSAASGEQDNWTITVSGPEIETRDLQFPGAFQPRQIDVHTSAIGHTEALILGTGEELVYVDVDLFLTAPNPQSAVLGVSADLVSARFVSGLPQHGFSQPPIPEQDLVHIVAGVATDDVLNVRSGPGTENPIAFELEPNATGVVSFGPVVGSPDGGLWVQVYNAVSGQEDDSGWVNTAFLRPQDVPDSRPCLFNGPQDHYIGIDWRSDDAGRTDSDAMFVSTFATYRFGGCIRTVIQLFAESSVTYGGFDFTSGLPPDIIVTRESPIHVDFGESIVAEVRYDTIYDSIDDQRFESFISIDAKDGLIGELYMPSDIVDVNFDADRARIVIDVADLGRPEFDVGRSETLFSDDVVITNVTVDSDRFTITGLARPFEASLGLAVRIGDDPVTVEFVDTFVGPGDQYSETSVMTTSWAEAWGRFEFSMFLDEDEVDGLILDFDPSGGAGDEPTIISVPLADILPTGLR